MQRPMQKIALSQESAALYGAQIRAAAPNELELVVVDQNAPPEAWRDAEILLSAEFENDMTLEFLIEHLPRLKWLHTIYAGTDNIPWALVNARGIVVTNSAGVYAPMMAEYVIASVVMLYRNLHKYAAEQKQHRLDKHQPPAGFNGELFGKRMGILGYGATGRRLAESARGLGLHVWALRRTPTILDNEPVERILDMSELDVLLRESDILVITASLNSSTRNLLGLEQFRMMNRDAVLVNVARGAILDEDALVHALNAGWIRGAILDVTTEEPLPPENPLWDAPNLLLTPHISGEMPIGRIRSIELFCRNLRLYREGQMGNFGNRVESGAHI